MSVKRIYVEKKPAYAVRASELKNEIKDYLFCDTQVRVLIRYDIENISEDTYARSLGTIFSEPPLDDCYEETFPANENDIVFSVEYLPGQFDQRADSAMQCVKLLDSSTDTRVRTATTYVLSGNLTKENTDAIKNYCINPVDSRLADETKPDTLSITYAVPEDIQEVKGLISMDEETFAGLYNSLNLAMTFSDFKHIRSYFSSQEQRDPTMTEIRMLDTYWSDHCRHTTFLTELKDITIDDGFCHEAVQKTYEKYLNDRKELFAGRPDRYMSLMDLALMGMRKLRADGKLTDMEDTDEINACSIVVPVTLDGRTEEWLINFKNETHNHPTEIEPFGGAATCLGGAIRDPLSGRTYVYQAMRVTGAADPTVPISGTLHGKLPQRKIVTQAAKGYSSYGNQIGLATGYVKEIYHPNFAAKRMEIGAVMAAAPRSGIIRKNSDPGDIIILLGGRTGRDGIGGATGSSKAHTENSIEVCGAEVQKGNAPTERKLQRMVRRPEVSLLIKKCNDFGAGGVSVAIGELAPGISIDLDRVPKKYAGLDGTEIAISESQERMAVVVAPGDVDRFLAYAHEENLEAVAVAKVEEFPRLIMKWRGRTIVDISREFLDTNGAHQETDVEVLMPVKSDSPFVRNDINDNDIKNRWLSMLSDLNSCSQRGLVEMFDSSIGASSVLMPYGGKFQLSETQVMAAKLPSDRADMDTVTLMSCGYDPYLSSWSPYHGSMYAVIESVAKIVAAGGDYRKIHFTFQEYFQRMTEDTKGWGVPFSSLLGAYEAQLEFGLASIGGKDSMSGTFDNIHVPPTLVSFAVDIARTSDIISTEFKKTGSKIVLLHMEHDGDFLPDWNFMRQQYGKFHEDIKAGNIISAFALTRFGAAEAVSKMAFGNHLGVRIEHNFDPRDLFAPGWGDIVAEVPDGHVSRLGITYTVIGEVTDTSALEYRDMKIELDEALGRWNSTLESVFPTKSQEENPKLPECVGEKKYADVTIAGTYFASPAVFIPVFPGTNCEYDSKRAFETAGAKTDIRVFKNLSEKDINDSVKEFAEAIKQSQIVMFPGGFSAGDEPEGSAKFFAAVFRNEMIKEEIEKLISERDGLMLGICNGFQALLKLGLLPEGVIKQQKTDSPTLAMNSIGRHVSRMVYTKVVSNASPWLLALKPGEVYVSPASHGEGRFVAPMDMIEKLYKTGRVATQYTDNLGNPTMDEFWNPNGSYAAIEGILSADGRIFGKMAHAERFSDGVAVNITGNQDMKIFESGVNYYKL